MPKQKKISIDFRVWIFSDGEKLFGKGRIELLEKIKKSGSILSAAKEMKMSYRQAWQMVQEMNERAFGPLVEKKMGGRSGGGATITTEGEKAIKQFHILENKIKKFIQTEIKK
ncbi:MAG: LysR family transcriptional regulator [Bacteroidia bacterium]|nr:LysR family transcriptional regulator [Bacteroidia bacterium]